MSNIVSSGLCIFKAGKGVDETFYSGMSGLKGGLGTNTIDYLISGATSVVNDMSRENWCTNYATLNSCKKHLISNIVSNLVAIDLVTYNMGSYNSRVEAEDVINVRRDSVLRDLSILRDEKNRTFVKNAT